MCEMVGQFIQKKHEEEQAANARYWKILACYDDDDDYNFAITPNKPVDSLSMGDEHRNTIPATESDEFIKSCVENLVPNPSESEGENVCDVPACFTTFSNVLFDADYEFDSSDDQSLYDEDVPWKIFSNPLFEEEIIPIKIDQHHDNVESDLVESLRTHDSSLIISSKIDSLLDESAGELTLLKSIPPGIGETNCYPEEETHFTKRLLYDNSFPRPPEEFVSENSNAEIESFSPSPIPVEDSNSFIEEIDLSFTPDDPMPPGIEEDDYDSERDILILEELLDNYSLSPPENESFHFDIPSSSRPPAKPPDKTRFSFVACLVNLCVYDANPNSFDYPPDSYHPPHPTYETYSGDSCGNDSHFGTDCPPQFLPNYEPNPAYIQNYNFYPHDSPSFPQQYLCCDNYGGLHETFQCQSINQDFYNSNSSSFDQSQTPQFPVIHPPPQETSIEILHDQENEINSVETFLRKFNRYSFLKTPKVLLRAWDRVIKIKDALGNTQNNPEDTQELFRELFNDVQNMHEELAEYINTLGWNRPTFYNNGNDDDEDCTIAITSDFLITDSLSMGDEHLDTIPEKESDEFNKSSFEDLVPNPRVDEANCDPEEDIHLVKRLLYDNSSPRPPEEFVSETSNANIESFSPFPIPVEDNDSRIEEINLSFNLDDSMPLGIEEDDDDSERDMLIHEELVDN
nr:hypothetical protein [Tanacetum cinerariifolium]